VTKSHRLKLLLGQGYFPEELPPPFTTTDFAKFRASIGTSWAANPNSYPKSVAERYSVPRQKGPRRELSIVNPVAEYHVAKLIADHWVELKRHLQSGSLSVEPPDITDGAERAIPRPDFNLVALRRTEITALYSHVLKADISRFYGTLYTHAVPWALHGKAWAKANLHSPAYHASLGARLDTAARKGNDNQTLGIPVGPDSSRIISEIVAVSVDRRLRQSLGIENSSALRHVDDWFIGFDSAGQAEDAIAAISAACRDYQLELNPEKSRPVNGADVAEPIWPSALRQMPFASTVRGQGRCLEHFFLQAFVFAEEYPEQNILDFAVKRTRGLRIHRANWHQYETYVLKAARASPSTLPAVVQILTSYNANGFPIGKPRVEKLIRDLIQRSVPTGHHMEIAWSLFLAKALRIALPSSLASEVSKIESSVCALLTLDLRSRGLIDGVFDVALWEQVMTTDGLTSDMWLLAYEADIKGWLTGALPGHVDGHPYFAELKRRGVSFYDPSKNVLHIQRARPRQPSSAFQLYIQQLREAEAFAPAFMAISMGPV
jgi:hypothetical protein